MHLSPFYDVTTLCIAIVHITACAAAGQNRRIDKSLSPAVMLLTVIDGTVAVSAKLSSIGSRRLFAVSSDRRSSLCTPGSFWPISPNPAVFILRYKAILTHI